MLNVMYQRGLPIRSQLKPHAVESAACLLTHMKALPICKLFASVFSSHVSVFWAICAHYCSASAPALERNAWLSKLLPHRWFWQHARQELPSPWFNQSTHAMLQRKLFCMFWDKDPGVKDPAGQCAVHRSASYRPKNIRQDILINMTVKRT